jgi:hypothetical protein
MKEINMKKLIGNTMLDIAEGIETGSFGKKIKIGLTTIGSEHGPDNLIQGAELAIKNNSDLEVVLIGKKNNSNLETMEVNNEKEMHDKMEELLESEYIDGCVTVHYNFPIGVSTVGKVSTPGKGRESFIATTTGTSSLDRSQAMVKNAIHGIIAAKASGIEDPTIGILNLDGGRQVEKALKKLSSGGYKISFAESIRADKGSVMRGNDLLQGSADVMVMDTLTGNIMMKIFSSFTSGGSYESSGYGYGPGIGKDYEKNIFILSRASGTPVTANAISYAKNLIKGNISKTSMEEYKKAGEAGLNKILKSLKNNEEKSIITSISKPEKETVTEQISGIDIMDLEKAVEVLWKEGIYAESGMGCTGPIVMVNTSKLDKSLLVLKEKNFSN